MMFIWYIKQFSRYKAKSLDNEDCGYLHDGRVDKNPYQDDRRADKDSYPHNSNN